MAALRNGIKNFRRNSTNSQVLKSYIVPAPPIELNQERLNGLNDCIYTDLKTGNDLYDVNFFAYINGSKRKRRSKSSPPKHHWFADECSLAPAERVCIPHTNTSIDAEKYGRRGIILSLKNAGKKLEGILSNKEEIKSRNLIDQFKMSNTNKVENSIKNIASMPSLQDTSVVQASLTVNDGKTLNIINYNPETVKSVSIAEIKNSNNIFYIKKFARINVKKSNSKIWSKRTKSKVMSGKQRVKDYDSEVGTTVISSHSTFGQAQRKNTSSDVLNILNYINNKKYRSDNSRLLLNYTPRRTIHTSKEPFNINMNNKDSEILKNGDGKTEVHIKENKDESSDIPKKNKKSTANDLLNCKQFDPKGGYGLKYLQQFFSRFIARSSRSEVNQLSGEKSAGIRKAFSDSNLNDNRWLQRGSFITSTGDKKCVSLPSLNITNGNANLTSQNYSTSSFQSPASTFLNDKSPTTKEYSTNIANIANTNSNQGIPHQVLHSVLMTYLHDSTKDLGLSRNNRNIFQTSFQFSLNGLDNDMKLNLTKMSIKDGLNNDSLLENRSSEIGKNKETNKLFSRQNDFFIEDFDEPSGKNITDKLKEEFNADRKEPERSNNVEGKMLTRQKNLKKPAQELSTKDEIEVSGNQDNSKYRIDEISNILIGKSSKENCTSPKLASSDPFTQRMADRLQRADKYNIEPHGGSKIRDEIFHGNVGISNKNVIPSEKSTKHQRWELEHAENKDKLADTKELFEKGGNVKVDEQNLEVPKQKKFDLIPRKKRIWTDPQKGGLNESNPFPNLNDNKFAIEYAQKSVYYSEYTHVIGSRYLNSQNMKDKYSGLAVFDKNMRKQQGINVSNEKESISATGRNVSINDSIKKGDPEIIAGNNSDKTDMVDLNALSDIKVNANIETKGNTYENSQSILDVNVSVNITSSLEKTNSPMEKSKETDAKCLQPNRFRGGTYSVETIMERKESEKYSLVKINEIPKLNYDGKTETNSQNNAAEINDLGKGNQSASENLLIQKEILEENSTTFNFKSNPVNEFSPVFTMSLDENNIEIRKYFSKSSIKYFNNKYSTFDVNNIKNGDNRSQFFLKSLQKDSNLIALQDSKLEKDKFIVTKFEQIGGTSGAVIEKNSDKKTTEISLEINDKEDKNVKSNANIMLLESKVQSTDKNSYNKSPKNINEDEDKQLKDQTRSLKSDVEKILTEESNGPNENSSTFNAVVKPETNEKSLSQKLLKEKINLEVIQEKKKKSIENEKLKSFTIKNQSSKPYEKFVSDILENGESSKRQNFGSIQKDTKPATPNELSKNYDSAGVSEEKSLQDSVKINKIKYENKDIQSRPNDGDTVAIKNEEKQTEITSKSIVPIEMITEPFVNLSTQKELNVKNDKLSSLLLLSETMRKLITTLKSKTKVQTPTLETEIYKKFLNSKDISNDGNKRKVWPSNKAVHALTSKSSRNLDSHYDMKKGKKKVQYQFKGSKKHRNKLKTNNQKTENTFPDQYDDKKMVKHIENNVDYFKGTRLKETEITSIKEKDSSRVNVKTLPTSDDTFKLEEATGLRSMSSLLNGGKNTEAMNKLRDFTSKTLYLSKGEAKPRNEKPSYNYNSMVESFQNLKDKIKSDLIEKELKRTRESAVKDLSDYDFSVKISRAEDLFGAKMKPMFRYFTVPFRETAAAKAQENNKQVAFNRFHSSVKEKTFNQYSMKKKLSKDYRLNHNYGLTNGFENLDKDNTNDTPIENKNDNVNDDKKIEHKVIDGKDFKEETSPQSNDLINEETTFRNNITMRNKSLTSLPIDKKPENDDLKSNINIDVTSIKPDFIDKSTRKKPKSEELLSNKINLSHKNKNVDEQLSRNIAKSERMRNEKEIFIEKEPLIESPIQKSSMTSFINNLKDKTYKFLSSTTIVEHFNKNLDVPYKVEPYKIKHKVENNIKNDKKINKENENKSKDNTQTFQVARQNNSQTEESTKQGRSSDTKSSKNYLSPNNHGIEFTGNKDNLKYFPEKTTNQNNVTNKDDQMLRYEVMKDKQAYTVNIKDKLPPKKQQIANYSYKYSDKSKKNETFKDKKVEFWATKNEIVPKVNYSKPIERSLNNLMNEIKLNMNDDISDYTNHLHNISYIRPNKKNVKITLKPSLTNNVNQKNYNKNNPNNFNSRIKVNLLSKLKTPIDINPMKRNSVGLTTFRKNDENARTRPDSNYSSALTGTYDGKLPQKDVMKHFTMRNEETLPLMTSQRHFSPIHRIPPSRSLTTRSGSNKFIPSKYKKSILQSKLDFRPSTKLHPTFKTTKTKLIYDLYNNNKMLNYSKTNSIKYEKRIHTKSKSNFLKVTPKTVDSTRNYNIFAQTQRLSQNSEGNYNFLYNTSNHATGNGDGDTNDSCNKNILSYLYKDRKIRTSEPLQSSKETNYFASQLEKNTPSQISLTDYSNDEKQNIGSVSSFDYPPTENYMNKTNLPFQHNYFSQRDNTNKNVQPVNLQRQYVNKND